MKYINKDYSNRTIHIGLVASCAKGNKYGLLYGFRKPPYFGGDQILENKLLYFEKKEDYVIEENSIVSYLSYDYNGFTPKVDYVYLLSSLYTHNDKRGKLREDGYYHDDETWRAISKGIPYFDYQPGREYCIYYPIIDKTICNMWRGLFGCGIYMNKEAEIIEMYKELASINYTGWPNLNDVTKAITQIKKYIDSINAFDIIDTFVIRRVGTYTSRPGKDDYYSEDLYQSLQSDDKYLTFLLPTKITNIDYDNNAYPSDGYFVGEEILTEDALIAKEKAKSEYTKEKHIAFLISDYFYNIHNRKERHDFLNKKIREGFDLENAKLITNKFNGIISDEFLSLINNYNDMTTRGLLETPSQK